VLDSHLNVLMAWHYGAAIWRIPEQYIAMEVKQEAQLPLRNRASATYIFVAKLISIAHSCL